MSQRVNPPRGFYPASGQAARGVVPLKPRARPVIPLSPGMRMKELLARPDVARLVRTTPVQDLFLLVKQVGLSDSLEVLELATGEQVQRMMDLDVWNRDELDADSYGEWLAVVLEARGHKLKQLFDELDPEPLVLFLKQHVTVHVADEEQTEAEALELEGRNVVPTPDRRYLLEIPLDDEQQDFIRLFFERIYQTDLKLAHWLLECLRWELPSQLEEQAYRLRSGRIEELGFHDFFAAQEVYQPLKEFRRPMRREPVPHPAAGPFRDVPLPLEYIRPSDQTLLSRALERLREQHPDDDLSRDLVRLANKVVAADRLNPGELDDLRTALRQVRAYVNLGLELQSGGELEQAVELLTSAHVEWLFRRGHTAALELQKRAKALSSHLRPALRRLPGRHADPPMRQVLEGLANLRPLYFVGLEKPESVELVPFGSRAQVERTAAALERLEASYAFVFDFLAPGPVEIEPLRRSLAAQDLELTPGGVFLTSLAQGMLGEAFAPEPLSGASLRAFLARAFVPEGRAGELRPLSSEFLARVQASVDAFTKEAGAESGAMVREFVDEQLVFLREAYGALDLSVPLSLEFLGGPLYLCRESEGSEAE